MTGFCSVVVWQAPYRVYGAVVGYDVRLFRPDDGSRVDEVIALKDRDEFFHRVGELEQNSNMLVQVLTTIP